MCALCSHCQRFYPWKVPLQSVSAWYNDLWILVGRAGHAKSHHVRSVLVVITLFNFVRVLVLSHPQQISRVSSVHRPALSRMRWTARQIGSVHRHNSMDVRPETVTYVGLMNCLMQSNIFLQFVPLCPEINFLSAASVMRLAPVLSALPCQSWTPHCGGSSPNSLARVTLVTLAVTATVQL